MFVFIINNFFISNINIKVLLLFITKNYLTFFFHISFKMKYIYYIYLNKLYYCKKI